MKNHRFLRLAIVAASSLFIGVTVNGAVHHTTQPVAITAQASRYNIYLTNRVNRFAIQRIPYYHPFITRDTRDLGGLRAGSHYEIRPGMLYRSGNLHYLRWYGARELRRLNIHHDIDLRALRGPNSSIHAKPQPGEFHLMRDSHHIHMHYYYYPVENSRQEAYTWPIRKRLGETYRFGYWYTTNPTARRAYHNSIMEMINNGRSRRNSPLMYNCTQGRDRTGVLSIITEYLLGVSRYNIYNSFLLTNYYTYQSPYTDQITRINRFFRTVKKYYGSMYRYVHRGLYLNNYDIRRLRREYLKRL